LAMSDSTHSLRTFWLSATLADLRILLSIFS
jgi:hypothetical protein